MHEALKLKNAPIVEAILDIECDMPPNINVAALQEAAKKIFLPQYSKFRSILLQEHRIELRPEGRPPEMSANTKLQGFQLLQEDEKQLVQVRASGFSFNRLAPYSTLDDYLNEMERTWKLFVNLASPIRTRLVQLRYINRILLPMAGGKVELNDYLKKGPNLPDDERLELLSFLNQHTAFEHGTDNRINLVLASQPVEGEKLPIILDIAAAKMKFTELTDWSEILKTVQSLRDLKNRVFRNTLTETCLNLFQH